MKKAFLVLRLDYGGSQLFGVYSDRPAAEKRMAELQNKQVEEMNRNRNQKWLKEFGPFTVDDVDDFIVLECATDTDIEEQV